MYFKKVPALLTYVFPKAIWKIDTTEYVYLTFDDGPNIESTPLLLDTLDELDIKANFFCLGIRTQEQPDLINEIKKRGHFVGYHGYNHISGWSTNFSDYLKNAEIPSSQGFSSAYRPPYGRMTWKQYRAIKNRSQIYMWNIMPGDFDINHSSKTLLLCLKKYTSSGSIIAMHDTYDAWNKNQFIMGDFNDFVKGKNLKFGLFQDL